MRRTIPSSDSTATLTFVPGGVCRTALSSSARPICWTRSSSPMPRDGGVGARASTIRLPCRAPSPRNSRTSVRAAADRSTGSRTSPDGAGVEPAQVEQVAGELRQPAHLLAGRLHELGARVRVEVLLGQELEEPAQREERRAQLVRRIGDEVLARAVDLGEPGLHEVERARHLAELVGRWSPMGWSNVPAAMRLAASFRRSSRTEIASAAPHPTTTATATATSGGDEDLALDERRGGVHVAQALREEEQSALHRERDDDAAVRRAARATPIGAPPRQEGSWRQERRRELDRRALTAAHVQIPGDRRVRELLRPQERAPQVLSVSHRALEARRRPAELRDAAPAGRAGRCTRSSRRLGTT